MTRFWSMHWRTYADVSIEHVGCMPPGEENVQDYTRRLANMGERKTEWRQSSTTIVPLIEVKSLRISVGVAHCIVHAA